MVRLRIDDYDIALSPDFSMELNSENPFFSRTGDYTYEIEINLNDAQNRIAFGHLERVTAQRSKKSRQAYLYEGVRLICSGKEAILEKNNDSVKIQIVSNNAELNYIAKNEDKLRSLDLGSIPTPTESYAVSIRDKYYPDTNYCFPMLMKTNTHPSKSNDNFINLISGSPTSSNYSMSSGTKLLPQPFLLYYVEKVVEAMGYSISYNCLLEEERWKHLVVIHGYDTLEYAKMLPDWTVSEFIDNCERFFNVIFLLDSSSKKISIRNIKTYYDNKKTKEIDDSNVIRNFVRKFADTEGTDSNTLYINYKNIKYSNSSTEYFRYANLDDDLRKRCTKTSANFATVLPTADNQKEYVIYHDDDWDFDYALMYIEEGGMDAQQQEYSQLDHFRPFIKDEDDSGYSELKIVPAEIYALSMITNGSQGMINTVAIPEFYENEDKGMRETIESGDSGDSAAGVMSAAFFFFSNMQLLTDGIISSNYGAKFKTDFTNKTYFGPWLVNSRLTLSRSINAVKTDSSRFGVSGISFELRGDSGKGSNDYNNNINVNTEEEFTFDIVSDDMIDVMSFILIKGRKFYIRKIKYKVENCKLSCIAEITCYPVS
jgi:hypothetical protein